MFQSSRSGLARRVCVRLVVCLVSLVSVVAIAKDPRTPNVLPPPTVESGDAPIAPNALDRLSGKWKLDWDQSDSFAPAMKALEVPWLLRKMAGLVSVQITIEVEPRACPACDVSLRIQSENPIKDTSRVVFLDGIARPFTDAMGNDSMDQFTWNPESGMEMVRERILGSGKAAKIHERRTVTEDLSTMVSTMTVWVDGVERASVRRVLLRVEP